MDSFGVPFYGRLNDAIDAAFPATLVHAARLASSQRVRGRNPRTRDGTAILRRLEGLRDDADLRTFLLERAKLGELMPMYFAAIRVLRLVMVRGTQSPEHEHVRRALGRDPSALSMVRLGLAIMQRGDDPAEWRVL